MKLQLKLIGMIVIATLGVMLGGCSSPEADAGPSSVGGAPVDEATKSRLQIADDTNGGGGDDGTASAATPPPEGN